MNLKKTLTRIIGLILCVCIVSQCVPAIANSTSAQNTIVTYLDDVKLIYAKDLAEAEAKVPEGYTLYKQDINKDMNEIGVYICYTTTTDSANAITDLRVMNENGGFDRGTFNDKMDTALESLDSQAEKIYKAIVNEFLPNLKKGLPGAKYAYDQFNVFMYDDETKLGDYFKSSQFNKRDISKMLLVCHNTIITSILSLLAQGLQREEGEDWLDKLEKMDPADYEMNASLQRKYADLINQIQRPLNEFSDQYNIMVYTDEVRDSMTAEQIELYTEDLADEDTVNWWYSLWDILNSHPLAGDSGLTAESVLVEWHLGESVANHKVCMLIDSMTEGQRALLELIGPVNFIFNDIFTEEGYRRSVEGLYEVKKENGTISLWDGIDKDIFSHEVGITSVAYDEMITSDNYDIFTNENYVLKKSAEDYVALVTNYSSIVFSAINIVTGAAILAKGYTGTFFLLKGLSKLGVLMAQTVLGSIMTYAPMIVLGICLLTSLVIMIVKAIQAGKPPEHDRTTIPKYMIDSVVDNNGAQKYEIYKRVDNVQTDEQLKKANGYDLGDVTNMCGSDVNANKGYHWAALYFSKNESVGNPIEASFLISTVATEEKDGYIPVRHFNKKAEPVSFNAVDKYNNTGNILYLYYKSQKLPENHSVYKYVRNVSVVNVSLLMPQNPGKYRFSYSEALAVAKKELTEMGMYIIDYDFSDDPDNVVMIGWSGTDNADSALKDIRFVHNSSVGRAGSGLFGSINYGNIGAVNNYSMFVSRGSKNPAPPVTMLKLMDYGKNPSTDEGIDINAVQRESTIDTAEPVPIHGWEAANEFTGGLAVPNGKNSAQLYFLPETVYTTGDLYLAGVEVDAYISNNSHVGKRNCAHYDLWNNDYNEYKKYKETNLGEKFYEGSELLTQNSIEASTGIVDENHGYSENAPDCPFKAYHERDRVRPYCVSSMKYNVTRNPYRAIYGIVSRTSSDLEYRNSFINYDGIGYTLCPIEATISAANIDFMSFNYSQFYENKKSVGKTRYLEDREYHSNGVIVNLDITQTVSGNEFLYWNCMYALGYVANRTPLKVDDLIISHKLLEENSIPDNFLAIPYIGGDSTDYTTLAPFTGKIELKHRNWSTACYCALFTNFYGYVRSEVKNGDSTTTYHPGKGEYITNIYFASKEKIRTSSYLSQDSDAECEDIPYSSLEAQLINSGATTTFTKNIGTDYYSDGDDNANTVYVGYTRSNDASNAIRDIRFYVCGKGEQPPKTIDATVNANGKQQTVRYTLASDTSLSSKANNECKKKINEKGIEVWEETELLSERQMYIYVTYNQTAFPDPIVDIKIDTWCSGGTYSPILSFKDESVYTVKKQSSVNLHVKDAWFEGGNFFFFKRLSNDKKYISEIGVENGDDKFGVMTSLVEDGYSVVNMDMNKKAAGDHIYIGVKYTNNESEAITNLLTLHKKDYYQMYSVTDEGHIYAMCSNVDLNKGAGGDYIYLYYTKDARAGKPLTELTASSSIVNQTDALYERKTVQRLWDFEYANMNAGTTFFTSDIYLVMVREDNTGKYISDLCVVYAWSESGAKEKLKNKGFVEYIDKDFNDGTGSSQYVYVGYKRTDDPNKAIRGLAASYLKKDTMTQNGITYNLVGDVNFNRHCVIISPDIYLYYTKDSRAGDPIVELYTSEKPVVRKKDYRGYHGTVEIGFGQYVRGESYCEFNDLAGGDYIYLVMISQPDTKLISSMFGNGSWIAVIISFCIMTVLGIYFILYKKRKEDFQKIMIWVKNKLLKNNKLLKISNPNDL